MTSPKFPGDPGKFPISDESRSAPESQIPPQHLAQFEPRLAIKMGHFWRRMDCPGPPKNCRGILGNLTFLTRPHFERYPRTKMAHFLQHPRRPPEGQISPKFGQFRADGSYRKGSFLRQMDWPRFPPKFWGVLENSTFLTMPHFERYPRPKWPIFCNIPGLFLRVRFSPQFGQF